MTIGIGIGCTKTLRFAEMSTTPLCLRMDFIPIPRRGLCMLLRCMCKHKTRTQPYVDRYRLLSCLQFFLNELSARLFTRFYCPVCRQQLKHRLLLRFLSDHSVKASAGQPAEPSARRPVIPNILACVSFRVFHPDWIQRQPQSRPQTHHWETAQSLSPRLP